MNRKIVTKEQLLNEFGECGFQFYTTVFVNGCFDLLHAGHVHLLQEARKLGDLLIVGLNSDASIHRLKGPTRPILPADQRAKVLSSLACVDYVVIFEEDTPEDLLILITPDFIVKGSEYEQVEIFEKSLATNLGITLRFVPMVEGISTSEIIRKAALTL